MATIGPLSGLASSLPPSGRPHTDNMRDLLPKLTQDTELHKMLADEKMRSEQHRTNYQTVKVEHTRLQDEYMKLQTELRSTIEESKLVQEKYKSLMEQLRSELADKQREIDDLQTQVMTPQRLDLLKLDLREELENGYRDKYSQLDTQTERYRAEYNKLKYEYSFLKAEYEHDKVESQRVLDEMKLRHDAEVTNLRSERETLITRQSSESSSESQRARSLQRDNTQLQIRLKGALSELEETRAQKEHSGLQTENVTRLQNKQLAENAATIKALQTERDSLRLQISSLQKELALTNDHQTQLTARHHDLEKDNMALKSRLEEETHKSKVEVTDLRMAMVKERGELERERDRLLNQIDGLKNDLEIQKHSLEVQEKALLEKEREGMKRVQAAREEEWQKLRELQNEKLELDTKLQAIERRKIDEETLRHAEKEKMEDRLQQAADSRQEAEKELLVLRTKLQHQQSLLESLERERSENSELKTRLHQSETAYTTHVSKERELADEVSSLRRTVGELEADLQKARESVRSAREDSDRQLTQNRASWVEEKSGLQRRVDELEDQLATKKKAYTNLITKMKQKLTLAQAKLEELTIEREALKKSVPTEAHYQVKKQLKELMRRHREFRMLMLSSDPKEINIGSMSFASAVFPLETSQNNTPGFNMLDLDKQYQKDLDLLKERLDMLDDNQKHQLQELKGISPIDSPRMGDITPPKLLDIDIPEKDIF